MRYFLVSGSALLLSTGLALAQTTPIVPPAMSAAPPVTTPPTVATPGATNNAQGAQPMPTTLSSADRRFVDMAAQSGLAEVQVAQLADTKSDNAAVKQFADRMVTDHSKANAQLMQIAAGLGVTPPTGPDASDAAAMQKLQGLTGAQFDRMYIRAQVQDHVKAVALFRTEAKGGQNPQLKQFAQQTLPILQDHLQMARALRGHGGAQG
jgi:putative membrane protein